MSYHCKPIFNHDDGKWDDTLIEELLRILELNHQRYQKYCPPAFLTLNDTDKLLFAISALLDSGTLDVEPELWPVMLEDLPVKDIIIEVLTRVQATQRHGRG